jgi:hypothetical protein
MTRALSSNFKSAVFAQRTNEYFLFLLVISGTGISTSRLANNYSNVTSGGNTYTACPFYVVLPNDEEGGLPRVQIIMENVSTDLIDEIRGIAAAPDITLSIVLGSDPNVIEWGPYSFKLRNVTYDKHIIRGDLRLYDLLNEPYPGESLTAITAPGAY